MKILPLRRSYTIQKLRKHRALRKFPKSLLIYQILLQPSLVGRCRALELADPQTQSVPGAAENTGLVYRIERLQRHLRHLHAG